ncbi:hypothetical protein M3J09_003747 [Ascochyta lentis]
MPVHAVKTPTSQSPKTDPFDSSISQITVSWGHARNR